MNKTLSGMGLSVVMMTLGASRGAEASAYLQISTTGITRTCDNSAAIGVLTGTNCAAVDGFTTVANDSTILFKGTGSAFDGYTVGQIVGIGTGGNQPGTPSLAFAAGVAGTITNVSATGDLTIDFAENNYSLPTGPQMTLSGSEDANWTTSSLNDNVNFQAWGRADNALTVPGGGVGGATAISPTCTSPGGLTKSCSSESPDVAFTRNAGNFALTGRTIIHQAIGTVASYTSTVAVTAVPEPASMLLLGTGLLGLARRASRKGRKQAQAI